MFLEIQITMPIFREYSKMIHEMITRPMIPFKIVEKTVGMVSFVLMML